MAKKELEYLKVSEPNVVHETIEGETILLNLGTGNYYSIEWPGTAIWDLLVETGDTEGIRNAFVEANIDKQSEVDEAYTKFIEKLIEEELVVTIGNGDASTFTIDENSEKEFSKAASKLDKLTINKYSDMQDMLLLDPIHDVDDKGWPEPKKDD